jgi:hypothetical protein
MNKTITNLEFLLLTEGFDTDDLFDEHFSKEFKVFIWKKLMLHISQEFFWELNRELNLELKA